MIFFNVFVDLLPDETCYFENIKSTNFILGTVFVTNTKSKNLRIHELVIFTVYITAELRNRCQTDYQVSLFVGFLISWISLPSKTTKIDTPRIKVISQYS
jgi:hypothetical protein